MTVFPLSPPLPPLLPLVRNLPFCIFSTNKIGADFEFSSILHQQIGAKPGLCAYSAPTEGPELADLLVRIFDFLPFCTNEEALTSERRKKPTYYKPFCTNKGPLPLTHEPLRASTINPPRAPPELPRTPNQNSPSPFCLFPLFSAGFFDIIPLYCISGRRALTVA